MLSTRMVRKIENRKSAIGFCDQYRMAVNMRVQEQMPKVYKHVGKLTFTCFQKKTELILQNSDETCTQTVHHAQEPALAVLKFFHKVEKSCLWKALVCLEHLNVHK